MKDFRVIKVNIGTPTRRQTELRVEAGRLWRRLVRLHKYCRRRHWAWPSESQLKQHFKGRFGLHSQTIQALIEKFIANIDSTRTKRSAGDKSARYPWRDQRKFQVVMWKPSAIRRHGNRLSLSNGAGRKKLTVKLPASLPSGKIVAVELGFRELRLTLNQTVAEPVSAGMNVVAADMGIIHLAVMTDGIQSSGVVGRGLRSLVQGKNRRLAIYQTALSKTQKGSRQNRKLRVAKARMLQRYRNQVHNLLHHAANQMLDFCQAREAGTLVVGDITEMPRNKRKQKKGSRRLNQGNSGNPLGQLYGYLAYKGKRRGIELVKQNEAYTSQTCPACGHRHKPAGRVYHCRQCGYVGIRDNVGACNQLNKYQNDGRIIAGNCIPPELVKYRRPVTLRRGVDRLTGGMLLDTTLTADAGSSGPGSHKPLCLRSVA